MADEKKPMGVRALMGAAYLAGALSAGVPLLSIDKAEEAKLIEMEAAELATADVRMVVAELNNSKEKQNPYHKYNPSKEYKAGDSVIVIIRDGATDSLMSRRTVVADKDGSLFVDKSSMVAPTVTAPEPIEVELEDGIK